MRDLRRVTPVRSRTMPNANFSCDCIRHLEIAAFLASLCKVCGIFETEKIPPNVNLTQRNPAIHWAEHRLRVPTEVEPLPSRSTSRPSLVAMTSSGIGGANGHCVVEGPPVEPRTLTEFWTPGFEAPTLLLAGGLSPRISCTTSAPCAVVRVV